MALKLTGEGGLVSRGLGPNSIIGRVFAKLGFSSVTDQAFAGAEAKVDSMGFGDIFSRLGMDSVISGGGSTGGSTGGSAGGSNAPGNTDLSNFFSGADIPNIARVVNPYPNVNFSLGNLERLIKGRYT